MPSPIDYMVSTQGASGGWGYHPGHKPVVEATALALLALRDRSEVDPVFQKGMSWLLSCQNEDGGWGIVQDDKESGWQTAWALIALNLSGIKNEARAKATSWLSLVPTIQMKSSGFSASAMPSSEPPVSMIWPWLPGQGGWIEPTALALLALENLEPSTETSLRIKAAHAYIQQNRTPSGGWDQGNASSLDTIILPRAYQSALVLLALAQNTPQEIQNSDITALQHQLGDDPGMLSLAVGLTAIQVLGIQDDGLHSLVSTSQLSNGSWEDNPYVTAWATIGLRGYL